MNSFTDGSAFCPGAPKRVPSDSAKHRRVYTSSNVCHSHEWRVDMASGKTLKKRNACLHAARHAVGKQIACIYGLRSEGVKKWQILEVMRTRLSTCGSKARIIHCPVASAENLCFILFTIIIRFDRILSAAISKTPIFLNTFITINFTTLRFLL